LPPIKTGATTAIGNAVHKRKPNEPEDFWFGTLNGFKEGTGDNRVSNTDCPAGLHTNLIKSAEYRLLFADRIYKHLFNNGALTPEQNIARWQKLQILCKAQ
jgi:hypothetical protein